MKDQTAQPNRIRLRDVCFIGILGAVAGVLITLAWSFNERRLAPVRAAFAKKFKQVQIGGTKEDVRRLLGKPTCIWPAIPPPKDKDPSAIDAITGATLSYKEIWDDVAERTYMVMLGPYPRWNSDVRVVGKHPDAKRIPGQ